MNQGITFFLGDKMAEMKRFFIFFIFILSVCKKETTLQPSESTREDGREIKKEEIILWHSYRGKEKEALEEVIKKFNEKNKKIEVKSLQIPFDAFIDKVTIAIPRGHGPDIFIIAHDKIGEFVEETKILEPLTEKIPRDFLKKFIPETVKALIYQQTLFGLPLAFKNLCLFYNKNIISSPPKTLTEMIKIAKENTDEKQGKFGLSYEGSLLYFHAPFLHGFGGVSLDDEGKPHIDSKEFIESVKFVRDLVKEQKIVPSGMTSFMVTSLFNEGRTSMMINGQWALGELKEGLNFAVSPLPEIKEGVRLKPFLGSEGIFLSNRSNQKDSAIVFMKYLVDDESALVRAKIAKQTVANLSVYENPEIKNDPVINAFKEQAKDSIIMPSRVEMRTVWSTTDMALSKSIFGNVKVETALKEAQEKVLKDIEAIGK